MDKNLFSAKNLFLFSFTLSIPFQEDLPTLAGFSITALIIYIFGLITFIQNGKKIIDLLTCPMSVAFLLFMLFCLAAESLHPHATLWGILRTSSMYLGSVVLASYIQNKNDVYTLVKFYIFSAIIMSLFVIPYGWRLLIESSSSSFIQSDALKGEVAQVIHSKNNLNNIAYTAMLAVGLCIINLITRTWRIYINIALAFVFFYCALITFSRSALVIVILAAFFMIGYYRLITIKAVSYSFFLIIVIFLLIPNTFLNRLLNVQDKEDTFREEIVQQDSRNRVYIASIHEISKNIIWGTGEGNMFSDYGFKSELGIEDEEGNLFAVSGTHNVFLGFTLFYGLFGLTGLIIFLVISFNYLPKRKLFDQVDIYIIFFTLSGFFLLFFMHDYSNKEYCIVYGLLLAYRYQIKNDPY